MSGRIIHSIGLSESDNFRLELPIFSRFDQQMLYNGVSNAWIQSRSFVPSRCSLKYIAEKLGAVGIADGQVVEGLLVLTVCATLLVCWVIWAQVNCKSIHVQRRHFLVGDKLQDIFLRVTDRPVRKIAARHNPIVTFEFIVNETLFQFVSVASSGKASFLQLHVDFT